MNRGHPILAEGLHFPLPPSLAQHSHVDGLPGGPSGSAGHSGSQVERLALSQWPYSLGTQVSRTGSPHHFEGYVLLLNSPSTHSRLQRKLSAIVDQVVKRITSTPLGRDPDSAAYVRCQYEMMIPMQQRLLWQRLLKFLPMAHDNLRVLDSMLGISVSQNSEIRYLYVWVSRR